MKIITQDEVSALASIGLTNTEQKVYVYLLEFGDQNPTDISIAIKIQRPNTYAVLKTLTHKGFVRRIKKSKRFVYRAEEPKNLLAIFSEQKKVFESVVPTLELLRYKEQNKPSIRILEGFDQVKNIYQESLACEQVFAIASTEKLLELEPAFFKNYWKALKNKGIFFKDILTFGSGEEAAGAMKEILGVYYDYKLMPAKSYDFSNEVIIYGDTVAFISYTGHVHAVTIKEAETVKTFRAIFNILWKSL